MDKHLVEIGIIEASRLPFHEIASQPITCNSHGAHLGSATGFQIAGPKAREVLSACTRDPISDMKFMDIRHACIGMVDCLVQRVSFTGDLGYEIYCDPMAQRALWETLWTAGQPHGMRPFGMRAMMSLRLDRFFGAWLLEYGPDYTPAETGLATARSRSVET